VLPEKGEQKFPSPAEGRNKQRGNTFTRWEEPFPNKYDLILRYLLTKGDRTKRKPLCGRGKYSYCGHRRLG
jgi:hypothetical protein